MKISPKRKSAIIKVIIITIVFILLNWFMTLYNEGFVNTEYSLGPTELYDFNLNLMINTITGVFAGILGGSALVYVNETFFRKKSYGYALKATFFAYSIVFIVVTITMAFLTARINLGPEANFLELYNNASIFFLSTMALVYYIFWGSVSLLTLFFLQISDKFGPGMLSRFLIGKYHEPRYEDRVFMFMDMKSSTAIAEKIGSKMYFNLLNEVFTDMTDAILTTEGEVYQYVGDEVVISWSLKKGVRQANCINCFKLVGKNLSELGPYYEEKYGVRPQFKAGLHHGQVTAGEIGNIKKDIVYSGDVLNTTSRIQEQCNLYQVDFLISGDTLSMLGREYYSNNAKYLGNIELRGKKNKIELNTLPL